VHELVRTNNAVLFTEIEALLKGAVIPHMVLDQHMSVLEGSLGILPRRILVEEYCLEDARRLLEDAGLAHELRPDNPMPNTELTDDAVLGGRLRLKQKKRGHRVGHDAILLAATSAAHAGDRVLDFGSGVGAAGLALAMRVPDVEVTLLELDPELAALAAENIERNGLSVRARAVVFDITGSVEDYAAVGLTPGSADRVLMNPPFHDPSRHNVSPDPGKRLAHAASTSLLTVWIDAASRMLHSAGSLTLIWRADGLGDVLAALGERFGGVVVLPVHGRAGHPAIRVLVRAHKGSRAPLLLLPGLMLNDENGKPTAEAESILRGGQALPMSDR
jgi:tRNA1(Val) A37 N6-methylase TrmN6